MTQDVIPNIQFGNSKNDFQTEKPTQNDALNVPAVMSGELTDTDDFRESNMNNDIQDVMQELANDPHGTVSEEYIAEQETIAQEAFDNIYQLQAISKRIGMRGVGMRDYMALEGIAPGILSKRTIDKGFTYQPSQDNVEISQEAISEKIRSFAEKAYETLQKIISYVIKKVKDLSKKYISGKMRTLAVKFKTLKAKNTDALQMSEFQRLANLTDADIINKLRECGLERLAATLKVKPDEVVASMKTVKTGASPADVVNVLSDIPGRVPELLKHGAPGIAEMLSIADSITSSLDGLLDQVKWEEGMIGEDYNLSKFGAKLRVAENLTGKQTGLSDLSKVWDVLDLLAAGQLSDTIQSISNSLTKADTDMKLFWKSLKGGGKDNTSIFKEFRATFYDTLRKAQDILNEVESVLRISSVTALFSGAYVTKFAKGLATKSA